MTNHHFHTVGSFLRGDRLTDARLDFKNGEIDQTELTAIEDEAIKQLVDQQIEAGLSVVTDGELRRSWWHYRDGGELLRILFVYGMDHAADGLCSGC